MRPKPSSQAVRDVLEAVLFTPRLYSEQGGPATCPSNVPALGAERALLGTSFGVLMEEARRPCHAMPCHAMP